MAHRWQRDSILLFRQITVSAGLRDSSPLSAPSPDSAAQLSKRACLFGDSML